MGNSTKRIERLHRKILKLAQREAVATKPWNKLKVGAKRHRAELRLSELDLKYKPKGKSKLMQRYLAEVKKRSSQAQAPGASKGDKSLLKG